MPPKTNRKNFLSTAGKYLFVAFFILTLSLSPMGAKESHAWDAIIGAAYHRMLDTIYDNIKGAILAALKQAAAKTINDLIGKLVTGSSPSSTKFIYDWQDYLKDQPKKVANSYINDYLSKVTGGMASSNFTSSEGFSSGSSYAKSLVSLAQSTTSLSSNEAQLTYTSDPADMFSNGNGLKDFNNYLSGVNNPWSFQINADDVWNAKKSDEEKIASDQGLAYSGYKATVDKDGNYVITPGSNTKDAVSNAQDIGNKAVASANHPAEVIVSIVTQILTKAITNGIGNIQSIISQAIAGKETSSVSDALTSAVTGAVSDTANSLGSSVITGITNSITSSSSGSTASTGATTGTSSGTGAGSLGQFWQSQGLPAPTQ
ncbi:MAG: hypothetical protein HGB08_04905 [Candidatus Moranbacteria bacterium]|nr:hypothetical protein [Candidatus Moranbacteria bacterium]